MENRRIHPSKDLSFSRKIVYKNGTRFPLLFFSDFSFLFFFSGAR